MQRYSIHLFSSRPRPRAPPLFTHKYPIISPCVLRDRHASLALLLALALSLFSALPLAPQNTRRIVLSECVAYMHYLHTSHTGIHTSAASGEMAACPRTATSEHQKVFHSLPRCGRPNIGSHGKVLACDCDDLMEFLSNSMPSRVEAMTDELVRAYMLQPSLSSSS